MRQGREAGKPISIQVLRRDAYCKGGIVLKLIPNILAITALSCAPLTNVFAQQSERVQNDRFQIFFAPRARADTFLLDKQTGKVWQLTKLTDIEGEPLVWNRMDRIDDNKSEHQYVLRHGVKETAEPVTSEPTITHVNPLTSAPVATDVNPP